MGPASHFLFGALCGAVIASVAVVVRRRLALYLPVFVLACGFWGELPYLVGVPDASHPLANVFFGYPWLHPWLGGDERVAFVLVVALASLLVLGYVVFLTWYFWTADSVRWELDGVSPRRRRSSRRRSRRKHSRRHRDTE